MSTRPAFGACTGVPAGLAKSAPLCGLRASPLNTLRLPNALLASCGTGRTNAVFHRRVGVAVPNASSINFASSAMRPCTLSGGFTKTFVAR